MAELGPGPELDRQVAEEVVEPELRPCPYPCCRSSRIVSRGAPPENWVECLACCARGPETDGEIDAVRFWNEAPRG